MKMLDRLNHNWQQMLSGLLLSLFIISLPVYTQFGKSVFNLLGLLAIFYVFRYRSSLPRLNEQEKIIFYLLALFLGWAIFTFYINGSPGRGKLFLWSRQFFIIILIPLYFLLRKYELTSKPFFWVLVLTALLMFLNTIKTVYIDNGQSIVDLSELRVGGGMHSIQYGSIAVLLLSMIVAYPFFYKTSFRENIFIVLAVFFLIASAISTQARGAWAGLPAIILVWLMFYPFKKVTWRMRLYVAMLILGVLASLYFLNPVQKRIDITIENVQKYLDSKDMNDDLRRSSVGVRFEMWRASFYIFKENPVLGVGLGGYQDAARKVSAKNDINSSAYWFYHPHNQFISELASKGLPGLVIYILLLAALMRYFYCRLKAAENNETAYFAFMGIQIVVMYIVFSLSDAVIEGKVMLLIFVVFIALILAKITIDEKHAKNHE